MTNFSNLQAGFFGLGLLNLRRMGRKVTEARQCPNLSRMARQIFNLGWPRGLENLQRCKSFAGSNPTTSTKVSLYQVWPSSQLSSRDAIVSTTSLKTR